MRILFISALLLLVARAAVGDPLIPREKFFGNPEKTFFQISPDGSQVAWLAAGRNGVLNVWVRSFEKDDAHPITNEPHRPVHWYAWAQDGQHVLYTQDGNGDGNDHLYSASLEGDEVRDLTPWRGVRAQNILTSPHQPQAVLVGLNLRDRKRFDMYRIDLASGAVTLEAANPGNILTFKADNHFVIRAGTAYDPHTAETSIRVRDTAAAPWRDLMVLPFEKALFDGQVYNGSLVAGFAPDDRSLYVLSTLNSNYGRIVRIDAQSGTEAEVMAEDPQCDAANDGETNQPLVIKHPLTGALEAVKFEHLTPTWKFISEELRADFERINRRAPGFIRLVSRDQRDRRWIVSVATDSVARAYYSYDRETREITPLFSDRPFLSEHPPAIKKALVIPARDGLPLVSYLTLPAGVEPKNLPLVLLVHGGPWLRDSYDLDYGEPLFLASRGYAVLQVNHRGSTGFGLSFYNAGNGQWGRGMQEDLYDAVNWAIQQGIADPKRIAAMGWSAGGFATLHCLEQRPDLFACGIDCIGPADVAAANRYSPPYWEITLSRWRRRVGDVERDAGLNQRISPLYHVDKIRAPLLVLAGQNDPVVTIDTVDAMVRTLRDAKREVAYAVYTDEGHGFERPENNFDAYGRIEEFLARHLGGRAEPWRKIEGSGVEVR